MNPRRRLAAPLLIALAAALACPAYSDDRPGKAGKFNQDVVALVEKAQLATSNQPNSWEWYTGLVEYSRTITKDMHGIDDDGQVPEAPKDWPQGSSWPVDPSEIMRPDVEPIVVQAIRELIDVQDRAGVFDQLDDFKTRTRFVRPLGDGRMIDILLPELGPSRAVARLCAARLVLAARENNQGECVRAFEHGVALARPTAMQFTLIDHLVSIAIQSLMLNRSRELALEGSLSPSTMRAMIAAIDRDALVPDPLLAMRCEYYGFRDAMEWMHTDDGSGDGRVIAKQLADLVSLSGESPEEDKDSMLARLLGPLAPTKKESIAEGERVFNLVFANAALGYRERMAAPSIDAAAGSIDKRFVALRTMIPALEKALSSYDNLRQDRAATKLVLAIALDHATYAEYPASVDKLRAKALGELKIDPSWLAEFRYQPRVLPGAMSDEGDDADAGKGGGKSDAPPKPESKKPPKPKREFKHAGFTLYALGRDGEDNQGRRPKGTPHLAMTKGHTGTDMLYCPVAD